MERDVAVSALWRFTLLTFDAIQYQASDFWYKILDEGTGSARARVR